MREANTEWSRSPIAVRSRRVPVQPGFRAGLLTASNGELCEGSWSGGNLAAGASVVVGCDDKNDERAGHRQGATADDGGKLLPAELTAQRVFRFDVVEIWGSGRAALAICDRSGRSVKAPRQPVQFQRFFPARSRPRQAQSERR